MVPSPGITTHGSSVCGICLVMATLVSWHLEILVCLYSATKVQYTVRSTCSIYTAHSKETAPQEIQPKISGEQQFMSGYILSTVWKAHLQMRNPAWARILVSFFFYQRARTVAYSRVPAPSDKDRRRMSKIFFIGPISRAATCINYAKTVLQTGCLYCCMLLYISGGYLPTHTLNNPWCNSTVEYSGRYVWCDSSSKDIR